MKNLKNASVLIRDDVTTLSGWHTTRPQDRYDENDDDTKLYTYKVERNLAVGLQPGSLVLVFNKYGVKVVKVHEVHTEPQIDLDHDGTYAWAFQIVDIEHHLKLESEEDRLVAQLEQRRQGSMRQQMLNALGVTGDEVKRLLSMPTDEDLKS